MKLGVLVSTVVVVSLASAVETPHDQEVLSMEHAPVGSLYQDAVHILESLPQVNHGYRTHYHSHTPSAPAQIIDYLSDKVRSYIDLKSLLNGPSSSSTAGGTPSQERTQQLNQAISMLEQSATHGSSDSMALLGDMHFFGNYSTPRNFEKALDYYQRLADQGNSSAQFMVGLCHSTGVFGHVPIDQARASLYYTFAAMGGDLRAMMAIGYRHYRGIAAPVDYEKAYFWYDKVANVSNEYYQNGPAPYGTRHLHRHSWVIADEYLDGAYGEGASEISSGSNAEAVNLGQAFKNAEQAIEYYSYLAEENDNILAHYELALLYYSGGRLTEPSFNKSVAHAYLCASQLWPLEAKGAIRKNASPETKLVGSWCAGILGQRLLRGEGIAQNLEAAAEWFNKGRKAGDGVSSNEYGMMLYHGLGGLEPQPAAGLEHIKKAAKAELGAARWNLAKIYASEPPKSQTASEGTEEQKEPSGDKEPASSSSSQGSAKESSEEYTVLAARSGVAASWYNYAKLRADKKAYDEAVIYLKHLSEKMDVLHSPLIWANKMYQKGDVNSALLGYLICAEQGYLSSQLNVAFLLDDTPAITDIRHRDPGRFVSPETALVYWTRASKQSSMDSQVKMGDYYLKGIGTEPDAEKAVQCYNAAADRPNGLGLARWNLGWMYETGTGVEQDYHLAKRYYDLAMESGSEAFLPAKLSLTMLHLKSFWHRLTGDANTKTILVTEPKPRLTIRQYWDTFWARWRDWKQKMWDELLEDDSEAATAAAAAAAATAGLYEGAEAYDLEFEDDLLESMVVIGVVVAACALIVWYRRRQVNRQMEETRRRVEQRRVRRDFERDHEHDHDGQVHRLFGANLGHPDDGGDVPPQYQ